MCIRCGGSGLVVVDVEVGGDGGGMVVRTEWSCHRSTGGERIEFGGGVSVEARETKVRNTCTTRVEGPSSFRGKFPEETEKNKFYSPDNRQYIDASRLRSLPLPKKC